MAEKIVVPEVDVCHNFVNDLVGHCRNNVLITTILQQN